MIDKAIFEQLKSEISPLSAGEGLKLVSDRFQSHAKFSTSFGMEDQVITHLIASASLNIDVFTLDTGRLFQETYDVFDLTRQKYNLNIKTFFPDRRRVEKLLQQKGPNSFYESVENRKECCFIRKVEPLKRALADSSVWITGLRADQSSNRNSMQVLEWDEQYQLIKYNPLIHWSQDEVQGFVAHHNVPVNTLHRKGFPSIGCAPCTRAVLPGEDPRAGRWSWESTSKECGLHEARSKSSNIITL